MVWMVMRFTTRLAPRSLCWNNFCRTIIEKPCPSCHRDDTVKRHGVLSGKDLLKPDRIIRGLRFYCSNRYSNKGCGRTFPVFFAGVLPRFSIDAMQLGEFISRALSSSSIHRAWHRMKLPFSLRSAYRWMRGFSLNQARLRPLLAGRTAINIDFSTTQERMTLHLLRKVFSSDKAVFIHRFQLVFQTLFITSPAAGSPS